LIAPAMGHADSRMVERVYGRLTSHELGGLIAKSVGQPDAGDATSQSESDAKTTEKGDDVVVLVAPQGAPAPQTDRHKYVTGPCDVAGQVAPMGRAQVAKSPVNRAQRRSRTADTGIFNAISRTYSTTPSGFLGTFLRRLPQLPPSVSL